jgi:hypothetical protein
LGCARHRYGRQSTACYAFLGVVAPTNGAQLLHVEADLRERLYGRFCLGMIGTSVD